MEATTNNGKEGSRGKSNLELYVLGVFTLTSFLDPSMCKNSPKKNAYLHPLPKL